MNDIVVTGRSGKLAKAVCASRWLTLKGEASLMRGIRKVKLSNCLWLGGLVLCSVCAGEVVKDDTYNRPAAVVMTMGVDEAMKKMENPVKAEVLDAFRKAHPGPFWLFGEDRQLAVRNNIVPAHWFEGGAKQFGQLSGVARPGEFYVFQVVFLQGEVKPAEWRSLAVELNRVPGLEVRQITRKSVHDFADLQPGKMQVLWYGVQLPATTKPGEYRGSVSVKWVANDEKYKAYEAYLEKHPDLRSQQAKLGSQPKTPQMPVTEVETKLQIALKVEGEPIPECGTGVGEAWRLARLKWLDSKIGESDTEVTQPFTPIIVDAKARTLDMLGRRITLGENGIPAQYTSFFSGSNTKILKEGRDGFAAAPRLECIVGGKALEWTGKQFAFTRQTPVAVAWASTSVAGDLKLTVNGQLEFDGNLQMQMWFTRADAGANRVEQDPVVKVDDVRFVVPWVKDAVKYSMGLGMQGGNCPDTYSWKWDISKHQDAVWLGDVNIGAMLRFKGGNYHRPLINAYYDFMPLALPESWGPGEISIVRLDGAVTLTASSGPLELCRPAKAVQHRFNIDWYFTPFKPLDSQKHFSDRYYHGGQGGGAADTAALKQQGVNVLNIHHNHPCNPYINYPYNDDSVGRLTELTKKAHADGVRVKVYYTTRELTQNLPEFFALRSLNGEVILPRKEGVAWPVTNPEGPHPWLRQHVGMDIVPAWRETISYPEYAGKLDLAMITTPDSRWNNFYLEGLDFLVKKVGIDGLYIDDTALDRKSMQRARRILDADGNTGRRVDMHSWNHFNGLAKWANSSIAFMELYPYYDRLWHGEGFNCDAAPEYMLVEMSGIPYGLMSEMLDSPNPWHGMVFGETARWPWSGDPRNVWKVMDLFGITDSEFIGWWDPACPVKTGQLQVKGSVYRKNGKTLIALASWAQKRKNVRLEIDWRALGLDQRKATLWAPAAEGFQKERVFAVSGDIPVDPGKGWLLIADERPREISDVPASENPLKGLTPKAEETAAFEIAVPANTVKTKDVPWVAGATIVAAHLTPLQDEGQSWGVGLAAGWADGKFVQINCRTSGQWGIRRNGAESLAGEYGRGKPATVAIALGGQAVHLMAKEDDGEEWAVVAEFPRKEFPGVPATIRVGKLGLTWNPQDHGEKGGTSPCRVDWVRQY